MEARTLILFFLTVFPLICTPGPGDTACFWICSFGFNLAFLFSVHKWFGVIYLIYLAISILHSATQRKDGIILHEIEVETISNSDVLLFIALVQHDRLEGGLLREQSQGGFEHSQLLASASV